LWHVNHAGDNAGEKRNSKNKSVKGV